MTTVNVKGLLLDITIRLSTIDIRALWCSGMIVRVPGCHMVKTNYTCRDRRCDTYRGVVNRASSTTESRTQSQRPVSVIERADLRSECVLNIHRVTPQWHS